MVDPEPTPSHGNEPGPHLAPVALDGLGADLLGAMAAAGARVRECHRVLAKSDANVVGEVLKDQGEFFQWDHYPKGDVYDWDSHAQYYYHAHPPENRGDDFAAEHGHFHTFLRRRGMPDHIAPAPLVDHRPPDNVNDTLTHFVGISMDRAGTPIRLFTTNRWVTGETWFAADDVVAMLPRFEIDQALPSWPVNVWVTNLLRLFQPDIERLLDRRDEVVAAWASRRPGTNVYEDRTLELTSVMDISVTERIAALDAALGAPT